MRTVGGEVKLVGRGIKSAGERGREIDKMRATGWISSERLTCR